MNDEKINHKKLNRRSGIRIVVRISSHNILKHIQYEHLCRTVVKQRIVQAGIKTFGDRESDIYDVEKNRFRESVVMRRRRENTQ